MLTANAKTCGENVKPQFTVFCKFHIHSAYSLTRIKYCTDYNSIMRSAQTTNKFNETIFFLGILSLHVGGAIFETVICDCHLSIGQTTLRLAFYIFVYIECTHKM
jgi:hypothetical protein